MKTKKFLSKLKYYAYAYKVSGLISKAFVLASHEQYRMALDKVESAERYLRLPPEGKLLKALLLYRNMRLDSAMTQAEKFEVDLHKNPRRFRADEVNYLIGYSIAIRRVIIVGTKQKVHLPNIDFYKIDLKNVDLSLKRRFPLVGHPDWATHGVKTESSKVCPDNAGNNTGRPH